MLDIWNTGDLSQLAPALLLPHGADVPVEEYIRLAHLYSHHIVTKLLVVDEHPMATRFWTSREGVDTRLAFSLVRVALVVLQLPTKNPRPQNLRRLRAVRGFLSDPVSAQYLRRASLCLQLIGLATSVTGQIVDERHELPFCRPSGPRRDRRVGREPLALASRAVALRPLFERGGRMDCALGHSV